MNGKPINLILNNNSIENNKRKNYAIGEPNNYDSDTSYSDIESLEERKRRLNNKTSNIIKNNNSNENDLIQNSNNNNDNNNQENKIIKTNNINEISKDINERIEEVAGKKHKIKYKDKKLSKKEN